MFIANVVAMRPSRSAQIKTQGAWDLSKKHKILLAICASMFILFGLFILSFKIVVVMCCEKNNNGGKTEKTRLYLI
jgi:hypothetical protein